jgi:MarR family transcriptional regulator, negative regulator of the multidrug operon emrRAB
VERDDRTANLLGALALTLTDRAGAAVHGDAGLAGSDAAALVTLRNYAEGEPLDVLRGALGLSHPGTVRLVDRLAARGLVARGRSERDGRAVALRLTKAGRRAADAALAARAGPLGTALGALTASERATLDDLLAKMLAAGTTDRASARHICRLCDPEACGHPERCPVTQAVR